MNLTALIFLNLQKQLKLKRYQKIVSRNNESLEFENYSYAEVVVTKIYYIAKYVQEREGGQHF